MVTAPLLTSGIKINLPESSSILKNEKKEPVTISLNKKGKIFINKKVFTRKKLITKLKYFWQFVFEFYQQPLDRPL